MKVYGVTGWKNAGKTTMVERLVREFRARGLRVSTLKHSHHGFDIDHEGKDSFRHRAAGAGEVIVASGRRVAQITELEEALPLEALLARLGPCDMVLIEGWKRDSHPKIEVHRGEKGGGLIAEEDPTIRAVASDVALDIDRPVMDLNDIPAIADFILADPAR
ncbi:molybdopterin-guanine dinucleotide biosynthesis protein B [Salipiger sp. P9]|uniref:molybdopterin-guanine dinucleotide biosynthesis protein B n=1 Tax=Salipiger pentaromativorans TaxID=2943193 RepID=UPI0021584A01|nr:molybdopterin-guanine dinucleotide biosynthesis protein B [Salipiger pentaromativorans]MCR8548687.1 molybdopterin-guanine dinucleotide biosynthesis protein B [Salipiger pentaromativorans]